MSTSTDKLTKLKSFLDRADFLSGSAILDLDGTAILEEQGKVFISGSVGKGLKEIVQLGRPVIVNTLRFPLSVIRTVAKEWLDMSNERIPVICLNGSVFGFIERRGEEIIFEEAGAYPLTHTEIEEIIIGLAQLIENSVHDLVLFFYPRDWRRGEIIWVPDLGKVKPLKDKYQSASEIIVTSMDDLKRIIIESEPCMMFLLVDRPKDKLMAYQHKEPSSFFTTTGVDKAFGLRKFAEVLRVSLADSMGAGNTAMDNFLSEVGLSVMVGPEKIRFNGLRETILVHDPIELGELMLSMAGIVKVRRAASINNENQPRNSG